MARQRFLVGLLLLLGPAAAALAQEWHEAYREGMKALAQGQAARAVSLLEYAAGHRPEPGRNVVTYGTNVEARYYPYLHLTEAYLQLRDLEGARASLKRSETWGREPAEERRRLAGLVEELANRTASPASTSPTPPPSATPAPPTPVPEAPPSPPPTQPSSAPALPTVTGPSPSSRPLPPPPSAAAPRPTPAATPAASSEHAEHLVPASSVGGLEVVSQPPGAQVYLDDQFIGTTDPEWGRLVRGGIPVGRHRVRLSLLGHQELTEEVAIAAEGSLAFRRRLTPAAAAMDRRLVAVGVTVVVVLLGLTAWAIRRPVAAPATATPAPGRRFDSGAPTPPRPTPPGFGSPGVRRDAQGLDHFGEYRLVEPLGRGGMASVFRAERNGEEVALKRPLAAFLEEPEFLERFLREAEIGRTLHHPNIVRILERGEVEGVPFFTMELVRGETLQAQLHRLGALEPRQAVGLVVQVAEALDYAHLKGVVHRDLKPSNVMVLPEGTAKVMDFGIARARRFEGLTVTGAFLGSPEYVAPETIEGGSADARSDLYSLGVVFYETLTARRPFSADSPFAILRKHMGEDPPPPSQLRPGLPAELERIVLRLLSKRPEQRPASAEELVLELRDYLMR